jgi:hypothetical protein
MRRLIYSLLFIFLCKSSIAQQPHFIYIQAETNQAFYVRLDDQFYNSSPSGYVIVPKLHDGSYKVKIGFPAGDGILQSFDCKINKKDQGYLLKNFKNGWALFNLETAGVTMAGSHDESAPEQPTQENTFSALLSDAVADPGPAKPAAISTRVNTAPEVTYNSNCKAEASSDDFLKLREKMASSQKDQEMISEAKRVFKHKCFTTDEIRNLSVLFLKDEGKYNFFSAAFPYVSDGNFDALQDQLTDNYYISRFREMTRH